MKSDIQMRMRVRMHNTCHAFTKQHMRCKKKIASNKLCKYHQHYYERWFETHPPLCGWRLNLDEKEEYRFQIENGHVTITDDYLKTFQDSGQSDYYEYLTHLPHIRWDTNVRMIKFLILSFINHYAPTIQSETFEYYFGRIIRNPSFCPGRMVAMFIFIMDYVCKENANLVRNISENRKRKIFEVILQHPCFQGWAYMNWLENLQMQLIKSENITLFTNTLSVIKDAWRKERKGHQVLGDELLEVALQPSRCLDWYIDWENKKEIYQFFTLTEP